MAIKIAGFVVMWIGGMGILTLVDVSPWTSRWWLILGAEVVFGVGVMIYHGCFR